MSGFGKLARDTVPPQTVVLEPHDFASEWEGRPVSSVAIGLRLVPNGVDETARAQAAQYAWELHPNRDDVEERGNTFSDAVVRWLVAKCTCLPNSVDQPYFEMAEDTVKVALTSRGIRKIWDAYEQMLIEMGGLDGPISDPDLERLQALLASNALAMLPPNREVRARKLLAFVLSELMEIAP